MKTKIIKSIYVKLIFLFLTVRIFSQNVGINDHSLSPSSSAMLDVKSTSKGMLIPRMTATQIGSIVNPSDGLQAYNTNNGKVYVFVSSENVWKELSYGAGIINPLSSFVCGNILIDSRDGKSYTTVLIETQCWMAQNLNMGTRINGVNNQADNSIIEKYCYGDNESNCDIYGGLYQWNEAMQYSTMQGVQGICPTGWHLPTDAEWTTLTDYVNNQSFYRCNNTFKWIAKVMAASTLWDNSSGICTVGNDLSQNNVTGFSALPGGWRDDLGPSFDFIGRFGYWWSSSEEDSDWKRERGMYNDYTDVDRASNHPYYGFSVRCIKD